MLLNAHTPDDFQIVGWLKRGIKRERNQIERRDEKGAGRRGGGCASLGGAWLGRSCRGGMNVDKEVSPPHELYLMKFVTSFLFI